MLSQVVRFVTRDENAQRDRVLRDNLDGLASKLGELQARVVKVESAGERVTLKIRRENQPDETRTAVIGRPVTFAGQAPDDGLAQRRYAAALSSLGFEQVTYVLEPVAAAHFYAQRLEREAVILVADLGGGTSDFSILRFSRAEGRLKAEPLGHAGIGIAGDTFDARIVDHVVAPRLGKGGRYRSFGKVLPVPVHYFTALARWHELAFLKGSSDLRELKELARDARMHLEGMGEIFHPLTRAAMASPISSGSPTRPSAVWAAICRFTSALSRTSPPPKSVSMAPGAMMFTDIPRPPSSFA